MIAEGDELSEGNCNEGGWNLVGDDGSEVKKDASFAWRGGQERQTTGIWMWSEPFIRRSHAFGDEKFAVLLMDTQGMFDNESTMTLTAQIFGLSTLVSSFQIYNVDKRIQEDNLQHLALFSEYGRMALMPPSAKETSTNEAPDPTPIASADAVSDGSSTIEPVPELKPFQRLQFLLRDWQNFDSDYEEGQSDLVYQSLRADMQKYLTDVLRTRGLNDLQSTREQITRCFEKLDCYMLPHPGFAVTKKTYDGSIGKIDPFFRALVNKYVREVFDLELEPKVINNRRITGRELQTYFEVYVKMFQAGTNSFPKAMTMLDATAEANNRNAFDIALALYKSNMEKLVGLDMPYLKELQLQQLHDHLYIQAVQQFQEIANMGSSELITKTKTLLKSAIESDRVRYFTTNSLRNPFKDVELYILPMGIAAASWFLAVVVDKTCSTDFCEQTEDTFQNIYLFIAFALIVLAWKHIRGALLYMKDILPLLYPGLSTTGNESINSMLGISGKQKQQ